MFMIVHMRYLFTFVAFISISSVFGQPNWGWDIAASASYSKNLDAIGPQLRAYILVDEALCYGLEYSRFNFSHEDHKGTFDELNFNGHYVFHIGHKYGVYPLGGINWSSEMIDSHRVNAWGFNAGGGAHVFLGKWVPYLEYLYTSGDLSDQKFILGTYFIIRDLPSKRKH